MINDKESSIRAQKSQSHNTICNHHHAAQISSCPGSKQSNLHPKISLCYLKKLEIDTNKKEEGDLHLIPEGHIKYAGLKKTTDKNLKKARRLSKNNSIYKNVKRVFEGILENEEEGEAHGGKDGKCEEDKKARQAKQRKVLKQFRAYTVHQNEEGKFKGWSNRAAGDMAKLCKMIRKGKGEYDQFR